MTGRLHHQNFFDIVLLFNFFFYDAKSCQTSWTCLLYSSCIRRTHSVSDYTPSSSFLMSRSDNNHIPINFLLVLALRPAVEFRVGVWKVYVLSLSSSIFIRCRSCFLIDRLAALMVAFLTRCSDCFVHWRVVIKETT